MKQLILIGLLLGSMMPGLRAEGPPTPPRPPEVKEEPKEEPKLSTGERIEIPDVGFSIVPPNGWMVHKNSHGSSLLFEAPKQPNQIYQPTIQVMVFNKLRYIDEVTMKEYGDLIVEKFGKMSNRVTGYHLRDAAIQRLETGDPSILYYTEFQYDDVPIMQMHILISSATNHFVMTYTDVAKVFEDESSPGLAIAYTSMHSAQLDSRPPWRWRGFVIAGGAVFLVILAWFMLRFFRARRLAKLGQRIEDEDNKEITRDEESHYYSRHSPATHAESHAGDDEWASSKPQQKAAGKVSQVQSSHFDDDDEPEVSEVVPISTLEKSLHPGRKRRQEAAAPRPPASQPPVSQHPVSNHQPVSGHHQGTPYPQQPMHPGMNPGQGVHPGQGQMPGNGMPHSGPMNPAQALGHQQGMPQPGAQPGMVAPQAVPGMNVPQQNMPGQGVMPQTPQQGMHAAQQNAPHHPGVDAAQAAMQQYANSGMNPAQQNLPHHPQAAMQQYANSGMNPAQQNLPHHPGVDPDQAAMQQYANSGMNPAQQHVPLPGTPQAGMQPHAVPGMNAPQQNMTAHGAMNPAQAAMQPSTNSGINAAQHSGVDPAQAAMQQYAAPGLNPAHQNIPINPAQAAMQQHAAPGVNPTHPAMQQHAAPGMNQAQAPIAPGVNQPQSGMQHTIPGVNQAQTAPQPSTHQGANAAQNFPNHPSQLAMQQGINSAPAAMHQHAAPGIAGVQQGMPAAQAPMHQANPQSPAPHAGIPPHAVPPTTPGYPHAQGQPVSQHPNPYMSAPPVPIPEAAMPAVPQFGQDQATTAAFIPNVQPQSQAPVSEQPAYVHQAYAPPVAHAHAAPAAPAPSFAASAPTVVSAMPQFAPPAEPVSEPPVTASRATSSQMLRKQPLSQNDDEPEMTEEARLSEILPKAGTIEKSKPKRKGLFWRKKAEDDDDQDEGGEDKASWNMPVAKKSKGKSDEDDDSDGGDDWEVSPGKDPDESLVAKDDDEPAESDVWAPEATKKSDPKKDSLLNETQGPQRLARRAPQGPVTKEQNNAAVTEDGWNLTPEAASDHDEEDEEEVS